MNPVDYPLAKWIGCARGNYRVERPSGCKVEMVVVHLMDGSLRGTDAWFKTEPEDRQGSNSPSSAHYGIGHSGVIHQYVREADTAFHAGRVMGNKIPVHRNPNWNSIGIEHEGRVNDDWPEAMVAASAALIAFVCRRHDIPIDRKHIVGHREIYVGKLCPGDKCPLDEIVRRAAAIQ